MKSETEQFNLRADKRVIEKLQKLADKFNRRSKAQIAVEIIEQYIDFWEQAETKKFQELQKQRASLIPVAKKKMITIGKQEDDEKRKAS